MVVLGGLFLMSEVPLQKVASPPPSSTLRRFTRPYTINTKHQALSPYPPPPRGRMSAGCEPPRAKMGWSSIEISAVLLQCVGHETAAVCGPRKVSTNAVVHRPGVDGRTQPGQQRFRGGFVFKAHRRLYHSTPGLRVIKKKKEGGRNSRQLRGSPTRRESSFLTTLSS